jgi:hypothetical protein
MQQGKICPRHFGSLFLLFRAANYVTKLEVIPMPYASLLGECIAPPSIISFSLTTARTEMLPKRSPQYLDKRESLFASLAPQQMGVHSSWGFVICAKRIILSRVIVNVDGCWTDTRIYCTSLDSLQLTLTAITTTTESLP